MKRVLAPIREWYRPRKRQSFGNRLLRTLLLMLSAWLLGWPLGHFLFRAPWHDGLGTVVWLSLCFALADFGYFNVYGGTEEDYPYPPLDTRPQSK